LLLSLCTVAYCSLHSFPTRRSSDLLIIPKTYPGEETPFVASGTILPISDYVDLMPHFQEKVEKWEIEPFLEELRQKDDKYYLLPGVHENVWPDYTLAIRTDIVEELDLDMPRT